MDDGRFKMNPPIRSAADRDALIEGLLDGTIDCIATDHAPHSAEEKSRGLRSLNGIVGLECAFPVLYTELVEPGIVPFATLLNALCVNPRRLFRLPGGKIEAGEIADLTVLDLNWPHAIDSTLFFSQGRSTPFDGWTVTAGVDKTICNGNLVYTASSRNINKTPHPPLSGGPTYETIPSLPWNTPRQLTADTYELVAVRRHLRHHGAGAVREHPAARQIPPAAYLHLQLDEGRPAAPGPGGGRRHP